MGKYRFLTSKIINLADVMGTLKPNIQKRDIAEAWQISANIKN